MILQSLIGIALLWILPLLVCMFALMFGWDEKLKQLLNIRRYYQMRCKASNCKNNECGECGIDSYVVIDENGNCENYCPINEE